eukprot:196938-Chlamydomonas_euryale.AAC.1
MERGSQDKALIGGRGGPQTTAYVGGPHTCVRWPDSPQLSNATSDMLGRTNRHASAADPRTHQRPQLRLHRRQLLLGCHSRDRQLSEAPLKQLHTCHTSGSNRSEARRQWWCRGGRRAGTARCAAAGVQPLVQRLDCGICAGCALRARLAQPVEP